MSQFGQFSLLLWGALVLCSLTGCGKDSEAPASTTATQTSDPANVVSTNPAQSSTKSDTATASVPRRQNERWTDSNGVEYLGDVPLDVFFDEPLTVARNQTPLQGGGSSEQAAAPVLAAVSADPAMSNASAASAEVDNADAASEDSWDSLLSIEAVQKEITDCRNFLNNSVQSYGDYKKVTVMIPGKAASIAVMATVAMEHPQEVTWKADAIYIRDLARQINEEPLQADKKFHTKVLGLFESIASTLDRSRPAGLAEPNPDDSFADVADMALIMVRIDEAEKRLKTEVASQAVFESKKDMIKHEAALLATLSHVLTLEGYGYEDDPTFVGYAKQMIEAAKNIQNATEANDFNSYGLALSKVSTSCTSCHSEYRNN